MTWGPSREVDLEPDEQGHMYQLKDKVVSCSCGWSLKLGKHATAKAYGYFEVHEQTAKDAHEWDALSDEGLEDENGCWEPKA